MASRAKVSIRVSESALSAPLPLVGQVMTGFAVWRPTLHLMFDGQNGGNLACLGEALCLHGVAALTHRLCVGRMSET